MIRHGRETGLRPATPAASPAAGTSRRIMPTLRRRALRSPRASRPATTDRLRRLCQFGTLHHSGTEGGRLRDRGINPVPFSHATPAAFGARNSSRNSHHRIARQMIDGGALDLVMGAGHPWHDDNGAACGTPGTAWMTVARHHALKDGWLELPRERGRFRGAGRWHAQLHRAGPGHRPGARHAPCP